nr:putative ankyrin repeat protein [Megavirus caiporensis]
MDNVFNPFAYDIMDEYYDIWKSLCVPSGTIFCKLINNKTQTNDLFLIQHDKLYNGKLNKQQVINYINCNNIHFIDKIYMTHLMCACIYSQYDSNLFLVKLLLKRNIDIECTDNTHCSALSYSLKNPGNVKIIKLLLKNIPKNNMEIINIAFIYWVKTDYLPNINMGKLLIDAGANINYLDIYGRSALFNIINNKKCGHIIDIVKFLLLNGSDINIIISTKPFSDWQDKKYDIMDYAIERYKWNSDKKIISILYDFGYHKLPNTNDDNIINYSKKIMDNINLTKTYFKTIEQDLIIRYNEIIYKPGNLRYNIIESNWNLTNNISNNVNIFNYSKIYNQNELESIIKEIYTY